MFKRLRCKHTHVRCIHGDEVWETMGWLHKFNFARVRCLDCGKALYHQPLPKICTVTGGPHARSITPD